MARGGPLVIANPSRYNCDTLVILLDRDLIHIPVKITRECAGELSTRLHTLTLRAKSMNMVGILVPSMRPGCFDHCRIPADDISSSILAFGGSQPLSSLCGLDRLLVRTEKG